MAVTRATFIAKYPGLVFSGITSTVIDAMISEADDEVSGSGGLHDRAVEYLVCYRLWPHNKDSRKNGRSYYFDEYKRLCTLMQGGPHIF